jgi:tRNA(Ile)-lysidine synthase
MDLKEEISRAVEGAGLGGKGILAAVSGGVDSVTLLCLLCEAGIRVEAAHVDHGLRADSSRDAQFCRELAARLGIPFHLMTLTREDFPRSVNVQAAGRELRRRFLEKTRAERGLAAIALAHHADDQVETVLFRLLRGAGPRGVCGMSPWEPPFLRPLLYVKRSEIESYAAEKNISFREDPTNKTPRYSRNRIRRELLPLARDICPGADSAILRFSALARRDEEFLTTLALGEFNRLAKKEPEGYSFLAADLACLPLPVRSRLYLAAFRYLGEDTSLLSSGHLEEIEELLEEGKPFRRAPVPGEAVFARSYDRFWVLEKAALKTPAGEESPGEWGAGVFEEPVIPGGSLRVELPPGRPEGAMVFRFWRPGDRLSGSKVKDILMEARVERWRRPLAVVAEDSAGIAALFAPGEPGFALGAGENDPTPSGVFAAIRSGWWKGPFFRGE